MKTLTSRYLTCLFGLFAMVSAQNSVALECVIEGKSPAVKVQWANKEFANFTKMASSNCEGAKIIKGDAIVYFVGKSEDLMNVELKAGQTISSTSLNAGEGNAGAFSAVISQMRRILLGDKGVVTGQKRSIGDDELNGFPYGAVLPPKDSLEIEIGSDVNKLITNFILVDITSLSQPIYSNNLPGKALSISSSLLRKGGRYQWTVKVGEKEYRGKFRIASGKEELEFNSYRHELDESNIKLPPFGMAVLRAGLYSEYGYKFDSARILGQALR